MRSTKLRYRRVKIQCPHCSETDKRTELRQPFDFSFGFFVLAMLGGMVGGLFYALGQESKFQCGSCDKVFFSHTTLSRIFLGLSIGTYAIVLSVLGYGIWSSLTEP